jgi:hypothetical protein
MKTRRFATALESGIVSVRSAQAPGFVSSMMVSSDGLCSGGGQFHCPGSEEMAYLERRVRSVLKRPRRSWWRPIQERCQSHFYQGQFLMVLGLTCTFTLLMIWSAVHALIYVDIKLVIAKCDGL